jgi:hypothetical protein
MTAIFRPLWHGRGTSPAASTGLAGRLTGHAVVTGPVRRWLPAIASPCVKTQGGQAERQEQSTEASTAQARSARTRSTQTGGGPGRDIAV